MSLITARSVGFRSDIVAATLVRGAPGRRTSLIVLFDGDDIGGDGGKVAMRIGLGAEAKARPLDLRVSFGLTW